MVTIAEVAAAAGVSISTVSYVMSGKRAISQPTRERVLQAVAELDYRPHAGARSLASAMTNVIGLQAPLRAGVDTGVVLQIVAGIVRRAHEVSYDVLLLTSDDGASLTRTAGASMVDALIVMDIESNDPRTTTLRELGLPTVLVGVPDDAGDLSCVDFDFEQAGRLAVERLVALGHRRVALLGAPAEVFTRHTSYADRLARGFLAACKDNAIEGTTHACPSTMESTALLASLLEQDDPPTAVLIHNEAALPHLAPSILQNPGLDLIALCPLDIARSVPGLTEIIEVPAEQIGVAAATLLYELIRGEKPAGRSLLAPSLTKVATS